MCNKLEGSYDKIVPSYTRKNITHLLPLALLHVLRTHNNTDGNNLVIFFSTALYYGDTNILSPAFSCQCTIPYGKKFSQTKIVLLTIIAIGNSKKNNIML